MHRVAAVSINDVWAVGDNMPFGIPPPSICQKLISLTLTPTPSSGLRGEYYNDGHDNGQFNDLALVRYDAPLNFVWGIGSPGDAVNSDHFSVRWTGKVQTLDAPDGTGTYTFQTTSDEGVRLWVNNQLIVDDWTSHTQDTVDQGQMDLQGGTQYDIRVEYYEGTGNATMQLAWIPPNGGVTPVKIPKSQLYPPTTPPDGPPLETAGNDTLPALIAYFIGSRM